MVKGNFTVIRLSGKTDFYHDTEYFAVLSSIGVEYGSAGGNWDRPNMLLLNGKVVVNEGIADIAWKYKTRCEYLYGKAGKTVAEEFAPIWLEDIKND